jgi:hypothetical protein
MRQDDARAAIEFEWRDWPEKAPAPTDGDVRAFYAWLARERPHLLAFRTRGDRFDVVSAWLRASHAIGAG